MENPNQSHGIAVKRIGRYLLETRDKGLIIKPDKKHSFTTFVDADFCGKWDKRIAAQDPNTAKSRTGFLIKYVNVPVFWQSKLTSSPRPIDTTSSSNIVSPFSDRKNKHFHQPPIQVNEGASFMLFTNASIVIITCLFDMRECHIIQLILPSSLHISPYQKNHQNWV